MRARLIVVRRIRCRTRFFDCGLFAMAGYRFLVPESRSWASSRCRTPSQQVRARFPSQLIISDLDQQSLMNGRRCSTAANERGMHSALFSAREPVPRHPADGNRPGRRLLHPEKWATAILISSSEAQGSRRSGCGMNSHQERRLRVIVPETLEFVWRRTPSCPHLCRRLRTENETAGVQTAGLRRVNSLLPG